MMLVRLLFVACLAWHAFAQADVYRCVQKDFSEVYQDYPCEEGEGDLFMRTDGTSPEPVAMESTSPDHSFWIGVLLVYLAMSLACYLTFRFDKQVAIEEERRVPERTLHAMELLGGWPGSLVAQHHLRHKIRKLSYQLVFWFIVLLHVAGWIDYSSHGALHEFAMRAVLGR